MFRHGQTGLEVLLVHPGGPFWGNKDEGAWSIPKGEYGEGEAPLDVARREFREETGFEAQADSYIPLDPIRQPSGKVISAWAFAGDCDASVVVSNTFVMDWPPGSGKKSEFPEVDRAGWFSPGAAGKKIHKGQRGFIEQLCRKLNLNQ